MSALDKIAEQLAALIAAVDGDHPCDMFALAIIKRRIEEQSHMIAEGLIA